MNQVQIGLRTNTKQIVVVLQLQPLRLLQLEYINEINMTIRFFGVELCLLYSSVCVSVFLCRKDGKMLCWRSETNAIMK